MSTNQIVPATQYLRMSTEHQQYSLENQSRAIQLYAKSHGFQVVQTYSDAAKSGLILRRRTGLQQLLKDVVGGTSGFRAILVYDVSRWGRFQDTDESAHYEFLCKSAGVPVHYCAETFTNDGSLPNLIMKALKRTMAGEYSRELGARVLAGQKHLATLGYKQGGAPGFGLRRMLVSRDRSPKQTLAAGERKSITTDRVILVPGPAHEVGIVREIFRMLIYDKRPVYAIARELNRREVPYIGNSKWHYQRVENIIRNPKYAGCQVFGRTTSKLYTPVIKLPKSEWIVTPGAFESIVDAATFEQAQKVLAKRTQYQSNSDLLDNLRALLASQGKLSVSLMQHSFDVPSPTTYRKRFGSVQRAYDLIGYGHPEQCGSVNLWLRIRLLRAELVAKIVGMFPNDVSIVSRGGRFRSRLRLPPGGTISVLIARSIKPWKSVRWQIDPVRSESKLITLLARLDETNQSFLDFHVFPNIDRWRRFRLGLNDPWLIRGMKVGDLSLLCEVVTKVGLARTRKARRTHYIKN